MRTDRFATLAAAIVVGGGTLLAASGADATGMPINGVTGNAVASQSFDFNHVSVRAVTWTGECPLPADRGKAVVCGIGTSP